MEQDKNQFQESQQGTGSAEQTGRSRDEQQQPQTGLGNEQGQDVADQIGEDRNRVSSIEEMGGLSGRDDSAGGSGDRMENQSSNERTDMF